MAQPTHEDATLMVQLARLHAESGARDAATFIWGDEFVSDQQEFQKKYARGSRESGHIRTLSTFYETVGTLVKHGLLNEELVLDWLAVDHLWERLENHLRADREETGEPRMWENFEELARRSRRYSARSAERKAA